MNITKDRIVGIGYTLTDTENQLLDSTPGSDPLIYLHGHENIIPGLERALEGKSEGDTFKITIPAADAYGNRDERLIIQVPRDRFEGVEGVEKGMQFEAETADGSRIVTVTGITGSTITVDGNHPLAGMDLNFDVTVMNVREASDEEIVHGHPHHAHSHENCGGCDGCGNSCCGH